MQEDTFLFRINGETIAFNLSNQKCVHSINSSLEDSQVTMDTHEMMHKEEKNDSYHHESMIKAERDQKKIFLSRKLSIFLHFIV